MLNLQAGLPKPVMSVRDETTEGVETIEKTGVTTVAIMTDETIVRTGD